MKTYIKWLLGLLLLLIILINAYIFTSTKGYRIDGNINSDGSVTCNKYSYFIYNFYLSFYSLKYFNKVLYYNLELNKNTEIPAEVVSKLKIFAKEYQIIKGEIIISGESKFKTFTASGIIDAVKDGNAVKKCFSINFPPGIITISDVK